MGKLLGFLQAASLSPSLLLINGKHLKSLPLKDTDLTINKIHYFLTHVVSLMPLLPSSVFTVLGAITAFEFIRGREGP